MQFSFCHRQERNSLLTPNSLSFVFEMLFTIHPTCHKCQVSTPKFHSSFVMERGGRKGEKSEQNKKLRCQSCRLTFSSLYYRFNALQKTSNLCSISSHPFFFVSESIFFSLKIFGRFLRFNSAQMV